MRTFARDPGTVERAAWIFRWPESMAAGASAAGGIEFRPEDYDRGDYAGTFTFQSSNGNLICNGAKLHVQGRY